MDLKSFIEIGAFVLLVLGNVISWNKARDIKNNCIATLTANVEEMKADLGELKRQQGAAFRRLDEQRATQERALNQMVALVTALKTKGVVDIEIPLS